MIAPVHLDLAEHWAANGVTFDRATVDFVPTVLSGLLEERAALHATIADIVAALSAPPEPLTSPAH